jgi:hypothetical protein
MSEHPAPELVIVSAHAVDRASLRALDTWRETARRGEGLHAWLERQMRLVLTQSPDAHGYRHHLGLCWMIDESGVGPTLVTLIREG